MAKIINIDDYIPKKYRPQYENSNPYVPQHPCSCAMTGKTRGGKSNLTFNFLMNDETMMIYDKVYVICRDTTEDKYKFLVDYFKRKEAEILKKTKKTVQILSITDDLSKMPDLDKDINQKLQNIIIFDDLMLADKRIQAKITEFYIRALKRSCSLFYLSQSYFKIPKTIRNNCQYFFFFEIPSRRELNNIYMEYGFDIDKKVFNKMVRDSTRKRYEFFMIDTKNEKLSIVRD
jgi:hypothetical protein